MGGQGAGPRAFLAEGLAGACSTGGSSTLKNSSSDVPFSTAVDSATATVFSGALARMVQARAKVVAVLEPPTI